MLAPIFAVILCILVFLLHDMYSSWAYSSQVPSKSSMLKPTTLKKYAFYYWTLHMDYTIIVIWRIIIHTLRKFLWRLGYAQEKSNHAAQLGELFLDTTLMLYMKLDSFDDKKKQAIFYAKEFNVPHTRAAKGYVTIKDLQVTVDLVNRQAIECQLEGENISIHTALRLTGWLLTVNSHVNVHGLALKSCDNDHKLSEIQLASTYTLAINSAAILGSTRFCQTGSFENQASMINKAMSNSFPKHTVFSLNTLVPYSKTAAFLIQARQVVFSIVGKYDLQVDPEAFFLETVMHAIDHVSAAEAADALSMIAVTSYDQEVCADVDWVFGLFVKDIGSIFADTKLHRSKVRWHQDMYAHLKQIDPNLAKKVDWCVAY